MHLPSVDPPGSETSFEKVDPITIDSEEDERMDIKDLRAQIEEMKRERKKMNGDMAQVQKEKDEILEVARLATTAGGTNTSPLSSADLAAEVATPVPCPSISQ